MSTKLDIDHKVDIVLNAIRCVGEDKLLKCSKEEFKAFEREIVLKVQEGDVDRTLFEEFCTKLIYLLNCLISSASSIKLYSTRRTRCWTLYHAARKKSIQLLWKNVYMKLKVDSGGKSYLFTQSVTQKVFEQPMAEHFVQQNLKK